MMSLSTGGTRGGDRAAPVGVSFLQVDTVSRQQRGPFYAYALPGAGRGTRKTPAAVDAAHYDRGLGEFILPYSAVRASHDPDSLLLRFLQSTYEAAAAWDNWDRGASSRDPRSERPGRR
jgi:hypothetical protein